MKGGWSGEGRRAPELAPATQAQLLARYQAGESYQRLAREFGISDRQIRGLLHREGVMRERNELRQLRAPPHPPPRKERGLLDLTPAERAVLRELAQGKRRREIATALFLDVTTVRTHLYHAFQKLGVKNSLQAVLKWQEEERKCDKQAG